MIKRHTFLLALLTAVFTAFTLGFFVGRNYNHTPVQISGLHAAEESDAENTRLILQAAATEADIGTTASQPVQQTELPVPSSDTPTEAATEIPDHKETVPAVQATAPKETTTATTAATVQTEDNVQTETTTPPTEPPAPKETAPSNSGLVNINTASAAQLTTLPGIGEVLAQRIVEYREANGPFQSVAALTNVKGIGEKRLAAIIDLVTI